MSTIIDIPAAERKISEMRSIIETIEAAYGELCRSAQTEAPGWHADSRKSFENEMKKFEERCTSLKKKAMLLFDAQEEYFRRLERAEDDYNCRPR